MKDDRDRDYEYVDTGMGNPGRKVYKGTDLPVPEKKTTNGFTTYEGKGVCGLCGRYNCSGGCFK